MAEEICIELPASQPVKKFYQRKSGIIAIICIVLVLCAGLFSWWLSRGKISSIAASLDMMVYTVGTEFPAKLKEVYVQDGELVSQGQPLASLEASNLAGQLADAARDLASLRKLAPVTEGNFDSPQAAEKEAASRLAQARYEEDRLRKLHQEAVSEHVRAQLAMRSISRNNQSAYSEAANLENSARLRMLQALEQFEKASQLRAGLEKALNKFRQAVLAARLGGQTANTTAAPAPKYAVSEQLVAPVAAKVLRIAARPGQTLQPGEAAFLLQPEGAQQARWIQAWFPMDEKDKIGIDQKVTVAIADMHLQGKVLEIGQPQIMPGPGSTSATPHSRTGEQSANFANTLYLPVRVGLEDASKIANLGPGTKAQCQIQTHYLLSSSFF